MSFFVVCKLYSTLDASSTLQYRRSLFAAMDFSEKQSLDLDVSFAFSGLLLSLDSSCVTIRSLVEYTSDGATETRTLTLLSLFPPIHLDFFNPLADRFESHKRPQELLIAFLVGLSPFPVHSTLADKSHHPSSVNSISPPLFHFTMRIEHLPRELLNECTRSFDKNDLLSLCLVSKRLLYFARPRLYDSVSLRISALYYQEDRYELNPSDFAKYTRDTFFRTISDSPNLASHITRLYLIVHPKSLEASWEVRHGKYDITERTIDLLRKCQNLNHLVLETHGSDAGDIPFEIIYAVPTSIKLLRIIGRPLNAPGLARLLSRLPSLAELDLSWSSSIESYALRLPVFNQPIRIRLSNDKARVYPFITDILISFPNLHSFDSNPHGMMLLAQSHNPHLRTLNVVGKAGWETLRCMDKAVSILKTTCDLEDLVLSLGPDVHVGQHSISVDIVQALPPRLKTIRLVGNHLFKWSSLLDYLRSERSTSLTYLRITRFCERDFYSNAEKTKEEVEVEELCHRRGARLRWMDEWGYW